MTLTRARSSSAETFRTLPPNPAACLSSLEHGLLFLGGPLGSGGVPDPVGGLDLSRQLRHAALVHRSGTVIEHRHLGHDEPAAACSQVESPDLLARRTQQRHEEVQPSAVTKPGLLLAGDEQPVLAVPDEAPVVVDPGVRTGAGGPRHPESGRHRRGRARPGRIALVVTRGRPGTQGFDEHAGGLDDARKGADLLFECERGLEVPYRQINETHASLEEPQEPPDRPAHRVGSTEDHQPTVVRRHHGPERLGRVEAPGHVSHHGEIGDRAQPPRAGAGQLDGPVDDAVAARARPRRSAPERRGLAVVAS